MPPRSEHEIFSDLRHLCTSPGFIHAIAAFCFRDTFLLVVDDLTPGDLDHTFAPERLIRSEITTLIGLLLRGPIDYSLPSPEELLEYLRQTEQLLQELHEVLAGELFRGTDSSEGSTRVAGDAIREPIFYCAESAYSFQYREFFAQKYRNDANWLLETKGFDLDVAQKIAASSSATGGRPEGRWLSPPARWVADGRDARPCGTCARGDGVSCPVLTVVVTVMGPRCWVAVRGARER